VPALFVLAQAVLVRVGAVAKGTGIPFAQMFRFDVTIERKFT
jgi:hypothetical protein